MSYLLFAYLLLSEINNPNWTSFMSDNSILFARSSRQCSKWWWSSWHHRSLMLSKTLSLAWVLVFWWPLMLLWYSYPTSCWSLLFAPGVLGHMTCDFNDDSSYSWFCYTYERACLFFFFFSSLLLFPFLLLFRFCPWERCFTCWLSSLFLCVCE